MEYDLIEINSKNIFGLYQVICRLKTVPIVTVPGVGKSIQLAKQAAAHQAIEALVSFTYKILCKDYKF